MFFFSFAGNLRILFEEIYGRVRGHSLSTFWSDVLESTEFRDLTDENKFQTRRERRLSRGRSPGKRPSTPDPPPLPPLPTDLTQSPSKLLPEESIDFPGIKKGVETVSTTEASSLTASPPSSVVSTRPTSPSLENIPQASPSCSENKGQPDKVPDPTVPLPPDSVAENTPIDVRIEGEPVVEGEAPADAMEVDAEQKLLTPEETVAPPTEPKPPEETQEEKEERLQREKEVSLHTLSLLFYFSGF